MEISWSEIAWDDYLYWQTQDKKTLKKINSLIKDSIKNGTSGIGHTEILKGDLLGWCSKTIDKANRFVFRIQDDKLEILQCRTHYTEAKEQ